MLFQLASNVLRITSGNVTRLSELPTLKYSMNPEAFYSGNPAFSHISLGTKDTKWKYL